MSHQLLPETKIHFSGKTFTVEQFAMQYAEADLDVARGILDIYIKKGKAKIVDDRTKEEKIHDKVAQEEVIRKLAEEIEAEEEAAKDYAKLRKDEGRLKYEEIHVTYPTTTRATEAERFFIDALRLKDQTEISSRGGKVTLKFYDITDADLNFINMIYNRDKIVEGALGAVNKISTKATDAVDYTAKKLVAPTAQIVAKTGISVIKSLLGTAAKTGASLVSATSQGVKDTYNDIRTDSDMIKASRDIIEAKDAAMRTISKGLNGSTSSGITIVK